MTKARRAQLLRGATPLIEPLIANPLIDKPRKEEPFFDLPKAEELRFYAMPNLDTM